MWYSGEYPTEDGQIIMGMGHTATSASNICAITGSQPVYIAKCGDKFYHKYTRVSLFLERETYTFVCLVYHGNSEPGQIVFS